MERSPWLGTAESMEPKGTWAFHHLGQVPFWAATSMSDLLVVVAHSFGRRETRAEDVFDSVSY